MANHLNRTPGRLSTNRRRDRGDIPIMTVVVMLMGSALVAIATAAAALAGHAVVAQSRLKAFTQAQSLGESALSVFYSQLQADPNYFTQVASGNQAPFVGADGNWHTFGPNGSIDSCPNQGGVTGLPSPSGPGCWALQVQETTNGPSAGGTLNTGTGQANQAATVTAYSHVDCRGTLASCTSAEVVEHLDRKDFLDFLYFTNNQVMDPALVGKSDLCVSGSGCSEPVYYTGDITYGPIYTQGQIYVCGSPTFDGLVETTGDPVSTTPQGVKSCAGSSPDFVGGQAPGQPVLPIPTSDAELANLAAQAGQPWVGQSSYDFSGNVTVVVNGSTLTVTYGGVKHTGVPFPSDGVIAASGNIYVQGTVAGQLTLAAGTPTNPSDIYVTGDLTYACAASGPVPSTCTDYTGLVATGSVFVDNTGSSVTLDAAMLAMSHSISTNPADLVPCPSTCPTLHIYGSMASQYQGVFGAYDGSGVIGEGFVKDFHYDYRLFHNSPPWMLSSQTGGWSHSAPAVVGVPQSAPQIVESQAAATTTTTLPPPTTTTTTTLPPNPSGQSAPACQSADEIASGTAAAGQSSFNILTCRTVPAGTTLFVGVSTYTASAATSVVDLVGNSYSLVASQPGVYLYGSVLTNPIPAGSYITVNEDNIYGASAIAEAVPGATLKVDQPSVGGSNATSPINATARTTTTNDDLIFLAAGGTQQATVTPSSMATDQVISNVSTVFASEDVSYGTYSVGMSWPDTTDLRSWMLVGLQMQGAQPASSTCPSSTDLGQGSIADNGAAQVFSFPVCRSVSSGTPVLVGVYTASTSSSTGVVDSAGNSYHLVASQPGVYLYGTNNPNGLQPGDEVTITATGNWGIDGIAEALPGVSLSPDQSSQGAQLVTPPVNVSYTTTMTEDDVIFMAAGGWEQASISPSQTVNDQLVNGMSAVFAASEVPDGSYSLTANWAPSSTARSWMLVALAMQGATPALHVSGVSPSPALPGWQVAITGTGFGPAQGTGYVQVVDNSNGVSWGAPGNAAAFTLNSWSNSQIVFTVPMPSGTNGEWRVNPGDNVQVTVHTASGQTSNSVTLGIAAPSCPSSTDIGQGTTPDSGQWTNFDFLTCRSISAGTPVLVAVYTGSSSATPTVADNTGNPYQLVASQPGVYLFGTSDPNGFFADEVITVSAQGDWGLDAIAEAVPGITFTLDQPSQGGYLVSSPVNTNFGTTMTEDDLLFLAAGGTAQASVSMPNMAIDDQIVTGMSGVFASGEVSYGGHSLSMSWPDTGDARSWMVVALEMQGATAPAPVTYTPSGPGSSTWTVPPGVHTVDVSARGGQGWALCYGPTGNQFDCGGPGGIVNAALPVSPGQVLTIYNAAAATDMYGGWGWTVGGNGGYFPETQFSGGGGGSSAIVDNQTGLLLVAGGGGGGGQLGEGLNGAGGTPNGGDGSPSPYEDTMSCWGVEVAGGTGGSIPSGPGQGGAAPCAWSANYGAEGGYPGGYYGTYTPGAGGAGGNAISNPSPTNPGVTDWGEPGGGGGAGYGVPGSADDGGGGGTSAEYENGEVCNQYGTSCYFLWVYLGSSGGGGASWVVPGSSSVSYGTGPGDTGPINGSVSITYTP